MADHYKKHCCDEERGCYALDCDSEEAECTCGCLRCDNAPLSEDEARPEDGGARCNRCGHYELSYERAEQRYAHCPSCSRHTRWVRVEADAPPSNSEEQSK